MNPVIAAAAVKAGKDTLGYASKVGQAVLRVYGRTAVRQKTS